jgi:hypothetical protein
MKVIVATIAYDIDAKEGKEWDVEVSDLGKGMLSLLTDFELKVCAAEASMCLRRVLEMPPSPTPK